MEKLVKPRVAPEAFKLLILMGMWRPNYASNSGKRLFYDGCAFLVIALTELLGLSMILGVVWKSRSIDEAIEEGYLLLPFFNGNVKCFNMWRQRRQFQNLIQMFLQSNYLPSSEHEVKIYSLVAKISRFISLSGVCVAEGAAACMMIVPLVRSNNTHVLPLGGWHPGEYADKGSTYWCLYLHQVLGLFTIAMWNTAVDVFIAGVMLQTCFQLDLVADRMRAMPRVVSEAIERNWSTDEVHDLERRIIKQSVQHHCHILQTSHVTIDLISTERQVADPLRSSVDYTCFSMLSQRIAEKLNRSFGPCILSQYCLSSLLLCVAIYKLTNVKSDASQLVVMLLYTSAMVYELFVFCFFGNEVTHKSLQIVDTVCKGDWTLLQVNSMRSLHFIMTRTSKPIRISCGPLITLSNNTFVSIIKLSYSVFNVLQQSK